MLLIQHYLLAVSPSIKAPQFVVLYQRGKSKSTNVLREWPYMGETEQGYSLTSQ